MTQSTPTEAWLKEAERAAKLGKYSDSGTYPNRKEERKAFLAGAQWQRERSAPDEQEQSINKHVKELCRSLGTQVDAGILEEVISLFNAGVLKCYSTLPKHTFDESNSRLTVSQCMRIAFEGKERIIELEAEAASLRAENARDTETQFVLRERLRAQLLSVTFDRNCAQKDLAEAAKALEDAQAHTLHWEYKGPVACQKYMETIRQITAEALAKLQLGELKAGRKEG